MIVKPLCTFSARIHPAHKISLERRCPSSFRATAFPAGPTRLFSFWLQEQFAVRPVVVEIVFQGETKAVSGWEVT